MQFPSTWAALPLAAALALTGCERDRGDAKASVPPAPVAAATAPAAVGAALQVSATEQLPDGSTVRRWNGDHFVIEWVASACAAAAECVAELRLRATAGFHLNAEYPYKFVPSAHEALNYTAKEGGAFSKASGDWRVDDEIGALSLRYRPKPGQSQAPLRGVFRMSVCNESACQIETPTLDLDVPVRG